MTQDFIVDEKCYIDDKNDPDYDTSIVLRYFSKMNKTMIPLLFFIVLLFLSLVYVSGIFFFIYILISLILALIVRLLYCFVRILYHSCIKPFFIKIKLFAKRAF